MIQQRQTRNITKICWLDNLSSSFSYRELFRGSVFAPDAMLTDAIFILLTGFLASFVWLSHVVWRLSDGVRLEDDYSIVF